MIECVKCKFDVLPIPIINGHSVIEENGGEAFLCSDCIEEDVMQDKEDFRQEIINNRKENK